MLVSGKHFTARMRLCLGLLAILTIGLAFWAGAADAKTIYACAQKHGSTTHRAKAALRLIPGSAVCLPGERRLSWIAGSGGPTTSAAAIEPGVRGPAGNAGEAGDPGSAGPQGESGASGMAGSQGQAGAAGAPGPQGEAGSDGSPGVEGPQGLTGPEGPAGPIGPPGPQGPFGPIGLEGPEGPVGPTGPVGPEGPVGIPGVDGSEGPPGPQGPAGPAGEPGSDGPQGEPGSVGPEGPQGPAGPEGERGPIGETGPEGSPGLAGIGTVIVVTAHGGEGEPADAHCPKEAPVAIGGGGSVEDKGGLLEISAPITEGQLSGDGQKPTGWRVRSGSAHYTSYAICTGAGGAKPSEGLENEAAEEKEAAAK